MDDADVPGFEDPLPLADGEHAPPLDGPAEFVRRMRVPRRSAAG